VPNVFVGNLSIAASEESVRALFQNHGTVGRVNIVRDLGTGQRIGFGFVEMPNDRERRDAITAVNETDLDGCTLHVTQACPKTNRWAGRHSDGVVLSVYGPIMRVALRDCEDAAQFTFRDRQWFAEDGFPVNITFLSPFSDEGLDTLLDITWSPSRATVSVN
jgi:RNA recognition motif-containing protein